MGEPRSEEKPFKISKRLVWEAYQKVKANKGAPGVDRCSIEDFEADLKNNLYRIWNRMSSGSYFPPPVLAVEIPKSHGGVRILGVPHCRGQSRADCGGHGTGEPGGADVPSRFLRLPAEAVRAGCGGGLPTALLEVRLAGRFGHPEVLRQRGSFSHGQGS